MYFPTKYLYITITIATMNAKSIVILDTNVDLKCSQIMHIDKDD